MQHSLDTYVVTFFALVFAAVLVAGGTSLFMAGRMLDKAYAIEAESRNVDLINDLSNRSNGLILAIHHLLAHTDDRYGQLATTLAEGIDRDIARYLEREAASPYPEGATEVRLLEDLRTALRALRQYTVQIHDAHAPGDWEAQIDRQAHEVQSLTRQINQQHFAIIARKVAKSRDSMSAVLYLYLGLSVAGLLLAYLGYRLHARHVVEPIKRLAAETERIAAGDLDRRIACRSGTEIGVLYRNFNAMVERLQTHASDLIEFNRQLEAKVAERTGELERACLSLRTAQTDLVRYEKMAMLGQIATSVNHEIRTPLNALYMNLQLIARSFAECGNQCQERDRIAGRIGLIDREVQRISDMLEEFVRYARIAPPRPAEVDANRLLADVADLFSERAARAGVRLLLDLAEPPPRLWADRDRLVQALVNLCANAIDAMPEGGTLRLTTAAHDGEVEIGVADSGTGIPAEDMARLFQPFFTTKERGLGFGLAIVQRIVEDHGGRIACRSQSGEGTEFTLRLPAPEA
ncbi:MAG: ATP-binding protein [Gallionellaceae bacterium]|nr:ATP-binding protein [Gallionellaceae bacterium]